ncbi:MAG: FUSC family protein [Pseudomonadota bacterium]|nr:FUSC family protein [Pseudomonadota bacterium]
MSPSGYSLRAQVVESLVGIKRPDVPWPVVLRNTAAVVLPLSLGLATGYPLVGLGVGAGALNTMFSDQPGPYRQRMRQLVLASLAAGLASLLGFLVGGQLLPLLAATAAFGFFGGLLVVFGTDTARVGMTSMILLAITASTPLPPSSAIADAGLIVVGGLLLTLFSLAGWPWQRYWPERRALAIVFDGLAALARQPVRDDGTAPALTSAMTTLQQTLLGRHRARGRAMEAFGVLLELAERIRLELTAMTELQVAPAIHAGFREDAAGVLAAIARALEQGESPAPAARALRTVQASERALLEHDGNPGMAAHLHALSGQLAAAVRNADWAGSRGELRASAAETRLPKALRSSSGWATLRAGLSPRSVAFRHAVRTSACLGIALLLSRQLQLPHGYWLPMTVAIVLRPDFAATFNFGLLRVLGTLLGLVLTSVLLRITPNEPWAHLALMAVLCMGFRYLATAHYGIAVAALTGTVVILLSFEGVNPGAAMLDRVINTALGSGMALLAYIVWPTWERSRARGALAAMLEAYAGYLHALAQPDRRNAHQETRTAARIARSNAEASIERMRSEPATPPELLALARALFANGNRLARSAMTLEALLDDFASLPARARICHFVQQAASAVQAIAAALREQRRIDALPDLRAQQRMLIAPMRDAGDAAGELLAGISDRLVDNVNTLAHLLNRDRPAPATVPDRPPAHS